MTEEEMIKVLDKENTDEAAKIELIKSMADLQKPPSEPVIQELMRIIRKPDIPEAAEGVYDAAVGYLKSISRY